MALSAGTGKTPGGKSGESSLKGSCTLVLCLNALEGNRKGVLVLPAMGVVVV
jgi:hypothetical protein